MKILALIFALVASPALAQSPPAGIKPVMVRMQLFCASSFEFLNNLLGAEFGEVALVMSHLSPTTTFLLYVNEDATTSSLVITKRSKNREEACLVWSGKSDGMSYSTNPAPDFPQRPGVEM